MRLARWTLMLSVWGAVLYGCGQADKNASMNDQNADAGVRPIWIAESDVPTKEDLFGVYGHSDTDVWAVGWNGTILHYDGIAWSKETTTSTVPLTDVHGYFSEAPNSTNPIFAVGWHGTILQR